MTLRSRISLLSGDPAASLLLGDPAIINEFDEDDDSSVFNPNPKPSRLSRGMTIRNSEDKEESINSRELQTEINDISLLRPPQM